MAPSGARGLRRQPVVANTARPCQRRRVRAVGESGCAVTIVEFRTTLRQAGDQADSLSRPNEGTEFDLDCHRTGREGHQERQALGASSGFLHALCGEFCLARSLPSVANYNPSALQFTAHFMRLLSACFEPDKCLLIACSEPVRVACSMPQLFGCMAVSAMKLLEFLEWLEWNAGPGEINRPASRQTRSSRSGR